MQNLKLTPAMQFVLHSMLSLILGALSALLMAIGQMAFTGSASLPAVLAAGLSAFVVYFSTHLQALWSNPQTVQAALDAANEAKGMASSVIASHQQLSAVVSTLVQTTSTQSAQPPVTVVNNPPAIASVEPLSAHVPAPAPVPQPAPVAQSAPAAQPFSLPTISGFLPVVKPGQ